MPYLHWIDRSPTRRFANQMYKHANSAAGKPAVKKAAAVAAIIAPITLPMFVLAQESGGGSEITFGVSSTLTTTDNKFFADDSDDTERTTESNTTLSFGLKQQTRTSALSLSAATDAQLANGEVETSGVEFGNHNLALSYNHDTATGGLSLDSRYSESDLVALETLIDDESGTFVTEEDPGHRNRFYNALSFSHGEGTPLELTFSISQTAIWYEDTISTSYNDSDAYAGSANAVMTLSPVSTLTAMLSYSALDTHNDANTTRETYDSALTLRYRLSPIWSSSASIGYTEIDQSGTGSISDQSGVRFGASISRQLSLGNVSLGYNRRVATLGMRDEVTLGGELSGKDSALSYNIGWSALEDEDSDFFGNINFTQDLPRGQVTLNASQNFATDSDGFNSQSSQVSASWAHQINSISRFNLSATYSAVDYDNPSDTDTQLRSVSASYNRSLTEDWSLVGGVRYRRETDADDGDATSNTVFVTVGRDFTFKR